MTKTSGSAAKAIIFSIAALGLAACGTPPKQTVAINTQGPEWVNRGSGAFKDGGVSVFYGVGIMQGTRNRALMVTGADGRARAEIAKSLETYVTALTKDYMAATTAGDMTKTSDEQHVQQSFKAFTNNCLRGSIIVDHWRDPADGTMFSLAKLDVKAMKEFLENTKELDSKMRDYVRTNAEKAFDEVEAEKAKQR